MRSGSGWALGLDPVYDEDSVLTYDFCGARIRVSMFCVMYLSVSIFDVLWVFCRD